MSITSCASVAAGNLMIAFAITLTLGACDWPTADTRKLRHLDNATKYFDSGQYHEALIELKNVTQMDPENGEAHHKMALAYLKIGGTSNLQKAFSELNKTVELNRNNHDAQLKLAELYLQGNDPSKAREHAEIVLLSAPQNTEGLILLGRSLVDAKRYKEGISKLKEAIELGPSNMQTHIDLARAYFAVNNRALAEEVLNKARSANPESADIMIALGDFYAVIGKSDEAEIIYKKALDIAPENESIYIRLTDLLRRHNRLVDAEAMLRTLTSIKPQDESQHIRLGDFFTTIGQFDKALGSYQRAIEINPASLEVRDKLIGHYLDTGKTSEAEIRVKEILKTNSNDLMGRFFDARICLAKNNADEAIALLRGVLKDEPQFAGAHHFLGVAFLQKHQRGQALPAFAEAIKINPRLGEARTALAQIHLAEGFTDLAIEQAQAAIQLNPRNIQAAIISGDAYLAKGDIPKSKQVFEAIAEALPNEPFGLHRLGLVARAEKNDSKAITYFEEALSKKPTAFEPLAQIVSIKLSQGKPDDARERVIKQLEASPNSPLIYNLLGQILIKSKDPGRAETAFKKAIELDSSLVLAYMNLGDLYRQVGKTDQAVKEYEAVLMKNPKLAQAHMVLGIIHEGRKQYGEAQARYEAILKLDPKFAPAANNLAWIMVEQGGNLDVALSYAQTAREGRPEDPYVADTLGWTYYKKNAYVLASSLLKEAVEKVPNEAIIRFHYGMALFKNGDVMGAKKSLQTALALNERFPGSQDARKLLSEL
jgi:tetratricopeptide (TPR) repeat protein